MEPSWKQADVFPIIARIIELAYREQQGLNPYPDIAIISRTLDFPVPGVLTVGGRKVLIFTDETADSGFW